MSVNWVMLSDTEGYTPLQGEQRLYTSPPRTTFSLQSLNKFPGKAPFHVQSSSGVIYLTNRRVIYLPSTATPEFQSFAAPILNLHDTHVDSPWFGPNTWSSICQPVSGGGIPPQHAALELKITFKEGGAFDFSGKYERVKERLQQAVEVARESGRVTGDGSEAGRGLGGGALSGVDLDAVHLDELPAYDGPGNGQQISVVGLSGDATQQAVPTVATRESSSGILPSSSQAFTPPAEPPPGYEEVQMDSIANELERRLRSEN